MSEALWVLIRLPTERTSYNHLLQLNSVHDANAVGRLSRSRERFNACLPQRADALFELTLVARPQRSHERAEQPTGEGPGHVRASRRSTDRSRLTGPQAPSGRTPPLRTSPVSSPGLWQTRPDADGVARAQRLLDLVTIRQRTPPATNTRPPQDRRDGRSTVGHDLSHRDRDHMLRSPEPPSRTTRTEHNPLTHLTAWLHAVKWVPIGPQRSRRRSTRDHH